MQTDTVTLFTILFKKKKHFSNNSEVDLIKDQCLIKYFKYCGNKF